MGIGLAPLSTGSNIANLVQLAWKAKRSKNSQGPQAILPGDKLQTVPKAKEKPTCSALLSRRLHKTVLLTVEIPPRKPFPPPLVWNPPPLPPPRSPGQLHARRPYTRPAARPHPYKLPPKAACAGDVKCK